MIVSALHAPRADAGNLDLRAAHRVGPTGGHPPPKRALYHNLETNLRGGLECETFAQNICFETEDAREGIRAFVEKRDPPVQGEKRSS